MRGLLSGMGCLDIGMRWARARRAGLIAGVALCAIAALSRAADVLVVKPGASKEGMDLSELACAGDEASRLFRKTLESDLALSGWFDIVSGHGSYSVSGSCRGAGSSLEVACAVRKTLVGQTCMNQSFRDTTDQARRLAHKVADEIIKAVKGVTGFASTRIAMIGKRGGKEDLYICDADGGNLTQVTKDGSICMAPTWSPRADFIFYTSFHRGYPDVYRVDLAGSRRDRACGYPGLNVGACVSPNGRSLAVVLSKDGNPEVYIMNLADSHLVRVTKTRYAAEASPSWSPDGRQLVYVSDRDTIPGKPRSLQLYTFDIGTGREKRLTLQGQENVAPDWGPDGRVACSSRQGGRYSIALIDPASGRAEYLSSGGFDDEDPSWARDGRHIVVRRTGGHHSDLYILDALGGPPVRLTRLDGDWSSPAWSRN